MKEIFKIIILSISSIVVLFILTKLMGYRQMSQLSMFDYINGITIGSIAAEMATSLEENFLAPLIAMVIYAGFAILLSKLALTFLPMRRFINGKSVILYKDGILCYKNFKKSKIDMQEFLEHCRTSGYFDLGELKLAVLEPNGKMSFLPLSKHRPATPEDLNLDPGDVSYSINIISDGKILRKNLKQTGNNEVWLENQLKANNIKDIKRVMLATCGLENKFTVFIKNEEPDKNDIFV